MESALDRRRFLTALPTGACVLGGTATAGPHDSLQPKPTLDLHVHLFGTGDGGSGCRVSERVARGLSFKVLQAKLRIRQRAKTQDEGYVLALAELLEASGLTKGVILAQDAVYDAAGKPEWGKTHCYVPNDYLFEVVARYPERMLPCVSINPDRADAAGELERCVEKGARVLKIHPPIQGVDVADKRHAGFFRRCSELEVVIMVHTGHEHSAPVLDVELGDPRRLEQGLDLGCTVVACHAGTGWPLDRPDMLPHFLAMVRKYPSLWGDTAVLGSAGRVRDVPRLLADDVAKSRLLHGSDFPFPSHPLAFAATIGLANAYRLQRVPNPIQQDLALKEALGFGRASAERGYQLLCGASQNTGRDPPEVTGGTSPKGLS